MIIAGSAKTLAAAVHAQSGSAQVATGTIYAVVQLEQPGNADDGKYWDANDSTWQASPVAWPTATHRQAGVWSYALPASATTGRAGAVVHYTMTDNLTEASATTVCGGGEHRVVADIPSTAGVAGAVWDEQTVGHQAAGSAGEALLYIATSPDYRAELARDVWDEALSGHTTPGTAGVGLSDLAERDYDYIAMAVWDEPISGHLDAGTTGAALSGATAPSAADVAGAVWDEVIADHLTAGTTGSALNTASPSAGSSMVTITVETGASVPVPGVAVSIFDATNAALQITGTTDPSGQLVTALDDGSYRVRMVKAGYTFTIPEILTVDGTTAETFTASAWAPTAPSSPNMCVIFGYLAFPDGSPIVGARVRIEARDPGAGGGYTLGGVSESTPSDDDGYVEIEAVRGAKVSVYAPRAGIRADDLTVPNSASQDLASWVTLAE